MEYILSSYRKRLLHVRPAVGFLKPGKNKRFTRYYNPHNHIGDRTYQANPRGTKKYAEYKNHPYPGLINTQIFPQASTDATKHAFLFISPKFLFHGYKLYAVIF